MRVFAVLGATGGIGSALSKLLAADGHALYLAGRNKERLSVLTGATGGTGHVLDAVDPGAIAAFIQTANEESGGLDGVACCIGSLMLKPAHATTHEEWLDTLSLNLTVAFETVKAAAEVMRKTGGSVALVSSAAAQVGLPNHEAIAAAKAGVIGLMRSAAATYARMGIRVNCVAPGMVHTPLTQSIVDNEIALKGSIAMHALGRIGEPEDVARALAWLLDPGQSWVTGQVLGVDGGLGYIRTKGRA